VVLLETIAQPSATAPALGSEININDDAHSKYGEISAIDVQVEVDDNDNNDHCQDTTKTKVEVVLRSSSMIQYAGPSF
jgi:hypothetical protein